MILLITSLIVASQCTLGYSSRYSDLDGFLQFADVSERRLEHFIISAKLSLELAKQKLDMYYTVRHLVPELFTNRDPLGPNVTRLNENWRVPHTCIFAFSKLLCALKHTIVQLIN